MTARPTSLSILATIRARLPGLPSRTIARQGLGEAAGSWFAELPAVDGHVGLPNGRVILRSGAEAD